MSATFDATRYRELLADLTDLVTDDPAKSAARRSVLVQAEAIGALEAAAHGVGLTAARAGRPVVSIETSVYGATFSQWLAHAGAAVVRMVVEDGEPARPGHLAEVLAQHPGTFAVALTHGEALTGVLSPLADLADVAHGAGAGVVVDAVATIGAGPAPAEGDVVVTGLQKAGGGGFGTSAVTLTPLGASLLDAQDPTLPSVLSLPYLQRLQEESLAAGILPGEPSVPELELAAAALADLRAEGTAARRQRHVRTRDALRAALVAAGIAPWVTEPEAANPLATSALLPAGAEAAEVLAITDALGAHWTAGATTGRGSYVRVSHYGAAASAPHAMVEAVALAHALRDHGADPGAAATAAAAGWLSSIALAP